jgi:peptidoglycan-associated lipoprotein
MNMKNTSYFLSFFCFLIVISSCTYTIKIKDGKTAFERKQYAVAAKLLTKEYAAAPSKGEKGKIAFMLAESYRNNNQNDEAITWYKTANENQSNVDAMREYAYSLKKDEQYKEASEAFKNLGIEIGSPYEYKREVGSCNIANLWNADSKYSPYVVEATTFNTPNNEYAPAIYQEGQVVITSDRSMAAGDLNYGWTGHKYTDLFVFDKSKTTAFTRPINTPFNEATAAFSADFSEMYFTRCGEAGSKDSYCRLMSSRKQGAEWSEPEALVFLKDKVNYGHPTLSRDGKTLYFSSNDPDGWGGYDIYTSTKTVNGFEEAKLLSRAVNSTGNEEYPFIDADTLYFSSDFHTGMGGLDVFKTYLLKDGNWAPIQNLKSPVNSGADDFGFVVDNQNTKPNGVWQQGYFTSNRKGGKGGDDIYKFEMKSPQPRPVPVVVEVPKPTKQIVYKMILEGTVLEKIFASADNPNSAVIGRKPLGDSKVMVSFGKEKKEIKTNNEGFFSLEMDVNTDYNFFASHEGYLNNQTSFTTKGIGKDPANPIQKFEIEVVLDKIYKNKEITLENIYYDYNKWDIRADAQPTLDRLSTILFQNPGIRIQLSSHTDCRGNDDYNMTLSQKRAESAVAYLISKGIEPTRLIAKGYGESSPAVTCDCKRCSEGEHQANRRTTFKVIE